MHTTERTSTNWRVVFWVLALAVPIVVAALIGFLLPRGGVDGPELVPVLARATPTDVRVAVEAQSLPADVLDETIVTFRPESCRSAADATWESEEVLVWAVLCRTGSEDTARKLAIYEINLASFDAVDDPDGFPPGASMGNFRDVSVSEVHVGWSVADVMVFTFVAAESNADLALLEQRAGEIASELHVAVEAAGFAAPLFDQPGIAVGGAAAFGLLVFLLVLGLRAIARGIRSSRSRRLDSHTGTDTGSGTTADVSDRARQLRWLGRVVWLGQGFVFIAIPTSFLISLMWTDRWGIGFPGMVLIAPLLVLGASALLLSIWRRVDGGRRRPWTIRHRPFGVTVLAAVAVVVIGSGLLVVGMTSASYGSDVLVRDLMTEEARELTAIALPIVLVVALLAAALAFSFGNWILRRLQRAGARTFGDLALASAQPKLLLRSFGDDELRTRLTASPRHGVFDAWSIRGSDYFEEQLAWELADDGPVLAIAEPGSKRRGLGVIRVELADEAWRNWVTDQMRDAPVICCVLGHSSGFIWEVQQILHLGLLERTIFVVPPRPEAELVQRWSWLVQNLPGLDIDHAPPGGVDATLALVIRRNGAVWSVGGDRRDEAGYRAAIERCRRWVLSSGSVEHGWPPPEA